MFAVRRDIIYRLNLRKSQAAMASSVSEAIETDLTNAPVRAITKKWNSIASAARNNRAEITRTGNRAVRDKHAHAFEF